MTATVALTGAGGLRDAVAEHLDRAAEGAGRAWHFDPNWDAAAGHTTDLSLVVAAADTPAAMDDLATPLDARRVGWLPVRGELDRVVIGPMVLPGVPGCLRCLDRRRAGNGPDPAAHAHLVAARGPAIAGTVSPLLGGLATATAAALVTREVLARLGQGPTRTAGAALMLGLGGLDLSVHRFLPDAHCANCGQLPDDRPEDAVIVPRSRPKVSRRSIRTRDLAAVEAGLLETYVDPEAGLLGSVRPSGDYGIPVVTARRAGRQGEDGYGRTVDFRGSRLTSVAEALERMGGVRPDGRRTVVRGSYRELKDRALDMTTVGVYPPERYATGDLPFREYDDDLELDWVWGYSFGRREPVLVPENYAYYRTHHDGRDAPLVQETSNGCALGSCVEEAVIHGLIEVAERDAFLMTWFARMPVPELDPATCDDHRIPHILERIAQRTGYRVRVFNTTLEQRIPCFWVLAVDGSGDDDRPRALCAAGSAIVPQDGVVNALQELAPTIEYRLTTYPKDRARAAAMVGEASLVRVMEDHALLYCHPAAFDRLAFLLDGAEPRPFADFRETWRWPGHDDLRDDLAEILSRYLGEGLDVVVVDQTTAAHRAGGFACVKTIVPGTLPMTFGHRARRIDGLPRLYDVPHRLGYRDRRLAPADVNPHPHPFP